MCSGWGGVNCCALAFLLPAPKLQLLCNPKTAKMYLHFKIASTGTDNATAMGRRELKLREGSIFGTEGEQNPLTIQLS